MKIIILQNIISHAANPQAKGSGQKGAEELSAVPICLLSSESWTPQGEGVLLDSILDKVLSQLQPVCLAEQAFCVSFLQLDSVLSPSKVRYFQRNCFILFY